MVVLSIASVTSTVASAAPSLLLLLSVAQHVIEHNGWRSWDVQQGCCKLCCQ